MIDDREQAQSDPGFDIGIVSKDRVYEQPRETSVKTYAYYSQSVLRYEMEENRLTRSMCVQGRLGLVGFRKGFCGSFPWRQWDDFKRFI